MSDYTKVARPLRKWHEDMGPKIWWRFPVAEAPYCGSPLDDTWLDDYYTHFTDIVLPVTVERKTRSRKV